MADSENSKIKNDGFDAPDVSMPTDPHKELEIIEEEIADRRRSWRRAHMHIFFVILGVLIVGLIFLGIHLYNNRNNPMGRLVSSSGKDFDTSFSFDVTVEKDGAAVMRYDGTYSADIPAHGLKIAYNADYNDYQYTNVIFAEGETAYKGNYYNGRWMVSDCTDKVQDFFDFHTDYRRGGFDGGAFLRFVGLTSDYTAGELEKFVRLLENRLGTNSSMSTYTMTLGDGYTGYTLSLNIDEIFSEVAADGAPLFYRASDYDKFCARYKANADIIKRAGCTVSFEMNDDGYMQAFSIVLNVSGEEYAVYCHMSDFGTAEPDIPEDFYKAKTAAYPAEE